MDRYVAFLRGMNIGGRRIKNEELRREFEELGLSDVSCFRASGNVIFAADEDDEAMLTVRIEAGLGEALDYEVPVFLRAAAELRAIADRQPFDPNLVEASAGKLQVSLLLKQPKAGGRRAVGGKRGRLGRLWGRPGGRGVRCPAAAAAPPRPAG